MPPMDERWGPFRNDQGDLRQIVVPARCRSDYANRAEQWAITAVIDYWRGNLAWVRPDRGPDFILTLPDGRVAALEVRSTRTKPTGYLAFVGEELRSVEQYELPRYRAGGCAIVEQWTSWDAERVSRLDFGKAVREAAKAKIDSRQLEGDDWDEKWLWASLDEGGSSCLRRRFDGTRSILIDASTGRTVPGSGRITFTMPDFSSLFDMPEVAYYDEVWLAGDRQFPTDGKPGGLLVVRLMVRTQTWEAFSTSRLCSFAPCESHEWHCTDGHIVCDLERGPAVPQLA